MRRNIVLDIEKRIESAARWFVSKGWTFVHFLKRSNRLAFTRTENLSKNLVLQSMYVIKSVL